MFLTPSFDYLKISIPSPKQLKRWGMRTLPDGSIINPISTAETLHYKTFKPVPGGIFCDRIFGPEQDWQCRCGKYKGKRKKDLVCPKCHVQVTTAQGRRHHIGLIELGTPVAHIWYLLGRPSYLSEILNMKKSSVLEIAYYACNVVISPDKPQAGKKPNFRYKDVVNDLKLEEYRRLRCLEKGLLPWEDIDEDTDLVTARGGYALKMLLEELQIIEVRDELKSYLHTVRKQLKNDLDIESRELSDGEFATLRKTRRRFRIISHFLLTETKPAWMLIEVLPVLPPMLRPLIRVDGILLNADVNEFYRWIILRTNRLKRCLKNRSPLSILDSERHLIQESVDSLIQNGKRGKPISARDGKRPLKSLTDIIKGKEGRFRHHLLGKRVDYSARSVIVVGAYLHNYQCGLPRDIAVVLFTSFLIHHLVYDDVAASYSTGLRLVSTRDDIIWEFLAKIISSHPVLLNRAPSLHRQNIQAFLPVLVYEKAIKLPPVVCSGYNADFDGDQMAVHLPLALEAQFEAYRMMTPMNFFSPKGSVALAPTQDMILGAKYLTERPYGRGKSLDCYFSSVQDVVKAYQSSSITLHTNVWILLSPDNLSNYMALSVHDFLRKATITKHLSSTYSTRITHYYEHEGLRCIVRREANEPANESSLNATFYLSTTPGRLFLNSALELTL